MKNFAIYKPSEESLDLDMAPVLSLVISLIPILLLTAVFVRVGTISMELPQVVVDAIEQDRDNPSVFVVAKISYGRMIEIEVSQNEQIERRVISWTGRDFDYEALHRELVRIKQNYPTTFRLDLRPDENTPYETIVKVMDEARRTKAGDPKVFVTDERVNQPVETNILFFDIYFGNVMEG